jgi:hypothetical protein
VWDASALYVVGGLGEGAVEAVFSALPGSVLPQSTLDDVIGWGDGPTPNVEGEQTILGWDAETQSPHITVIPADEVERQRASARGIRDLAHRLLPVADRDSTNPGKFDELLELDRAHEVSPAFMSWPATFAVAARRGLSIFSDDRYIRLEARRASIPTFGTVALLKGLVEREMLEAAIADFSVRRLRASGAFGLVPNDADLIADVAAADWGITELVARALHDPTGWRDITTGLRRLATLLRAVFSSAQDEFVTWVDRALEATRAAYPEIASHRLAGAILALSWLTDDAGFARAMTGAMRQVRRRRGYQDDPAHFATRLLANTVADKAAPVRLAVARAVLRATPLQEHPDLLGLMGLSGTHRT